MRPHRATGNPIGRPKGEDSKDYIKVGLRPDVLKIIDKQCDDCTTRRMVVERMVNSILTPKVRGIIETSGLPIEEVLPYLLNKATQ